MQYGKLYRVTDKSGHIMLGICLDKNEHEVRKYGNRVLINCKAKFTVVNVGKGGDISDIGQICDSSWCYLDVEDNLIIRDYELGTVKDLIHYKTYVGLFDLPSDIDTTRLIENDSTLTEIINKKYAER